MPRENRVRLERSINEALEFFIREKMDVLSGVPGISMTKSKVVSQIIMDYLVDHSAYPVRVSPEEPPVTEPIIVLPDVQKTVPQNE